MNEDYIRTVQLLLTAAPEVFANDIFAMKGGTALNRFIRRTQVLLSRKGLAIAQR